MPNDQLMHRKRCVVRGLILTVLFLRGSAAFSQGGPTPADATIQAQGVGQNRAYLNPASFEHIDAFSGNVILTYTDLRLPGNAGMDLVWQRVHNSNERRWTMGLFGVPMRITDADFAFAPLDPLQDPPLSGLVTADGASHPTFYVAPANPYLVRSREFWLLDRQAHTVKLPNGWIAHYDVFDDTEPTAGRPLGWNVRYLTRVEDAFGNALDLAYDRLQEVDRGPDFTSIFRLNSVTQHLGTLPDHERRVVTFAYDGNTRTPIGFSYNALQWRYVWTADFVPQLVDAIPPLGPAWHYDYPNGDNQLTKVTTPAGGEVSYQYGIHQFPLYYNQHDPQLPQVLGATVLTQRGIGGRGVSAGTWTYEYGDNSVAYTTTVTGPSTVAVHTFTFSQDGFGQPTGTVVREGNQELQREDFEWQPGPSVGSERSPDLRPFHLLQTKHTITRAGGAYSTTSSYSASDFADYGNPNHIVEQGDLTRVTDRTYRHTFDIYRLAAPASETIAVGTETFGASWIYLQKTAFKQSETIHAITTTFAPDSLGNVRSATRNGHTTSFSYDWGVVSEIRTPEYTVTRAINPEGTVASEIRGGRSTTFTYDNLSRVVRAQPPGGTNAIATVYDNGGGTAINVSRGPSAVETTLDGFGRPIRTINSVGVRTRTGYDAEGRTVYEGYPYTTTDIGTSLTYDGLGRVRIRINPDGTTTETTYGRGTVSIRDEKERTTVHNQQAFGHPDDARLTSLTDANGNTWSYTYNGLGTLTGAVAPDGIARTWQYDDRGLLINETQPEPGTVTYDAYDAAGNLTRKTDANGTVFQYGYDGNDRITTTTAGASITTTTFEPGSENRASASIGAVKSTFAYDAAGRLARRDDALETGGFRTTFEYDGNDNVTAIVYADGRRVGYEYDSENRVTRVFDVLAARDYAHDFAYHPSGAVASYIAGNGIVHARAHDPLRYWVRSISAGALQLTYDDVDGVGNVGAIGDARPGMGQIFAYDALDRLVAATGPYGSAAYAYDAHGNRRNAAGSTYEYQAGTLRLVTQNGVPFTYDNNGNLRTKPNASFSYTPNNMMASATVYGTTTTYAYDADDWRARKTSQGTTTFYLRGLGAELLTEWRDPGAPTGKARDYVYAGSRLIAVVIR